MADAGMPADVPADDGRRARKLLAAARDQFAAAIARGQGDGPRPRDSPIT